MIYDNRNLDKNSIFLVTGGAGFIGSNLCEALLSAGCRVRCLDNLSTGYVENVDMFSNYDNYEFILGDIRDYQICNNATIGVDYVLHQAALSSVPRSLESPILYCDNISGFLNLLESSRKNGVKRFVYASSSSVYGDSAKLPQKEGEEGNLLSPYALTKKCDEEWAKLYSMLYGVETIGLRYFNVFGKRQSPNGMYAAVIPKFIKALQSGIIPSIFGDGLQSRDFTYIENVVDANIKACYAAESASGKVYNIAGTERTYLIDVYRMIAAEFGIHEGPIYREPRRGDIRDSFADGSLAREYLGYIPKWSFKSGLEMTIRWYQENI